MSRRVNFMRFEVGMNRRCATLAIALFFLSSALPAAGQAAADPRLNELLETVRRTPEGAALAGAIVTLDGLAAAGAAGVRKAGTDVAVTIDDEWHLGSDTKAMTAAMIGALVERNTLTWETTPADVFPDLAAAMTAALRQVTLLQLLSHRAGLPANIAWGLIPRTGSTREQRLAALKMAASGQLIAEPGAKYLYSNLGYVIAGAMAEKASDAAWEVLMKNLVFDPLGMTGVGFGGTGAPGRVDQPWGHAANGKPVASNGPDMDNPPVMGPAGTVHCPLRDWAKFIADQLRGARGEKALLKEETYKRL